MSPVRAGSLQSRIRESLRSRPYLTSALQATRAYIHFGPWRHAARAAIRWRRPPLIEGTSGQMSRLSLAVPEIVSTLRSDGMARAGELPADMLRRLRAITDDLPLGEYGHAHEHPDVQAVVNAPDVMRVVSGYLGAKPELLECNFVVARAEDPVRDAVAPQRHFHFDLAGWQSLSLFVYLTDVDEESGTHQVVLGTHRSRPVRDAVRPWISEEEIMRRFPDRVRSIAGPAGTIFFEDTEAFHRRLILKRRRVLFAALFASHRSWASSGRLTPRLADYLTARAQGPVPVTASSAW